MWHDRCHLVDRGHLGAVRPRGRYKNRRRINTLSKDWSDSTSISLSELLLGVRVLPDGKRKEGLAASQLDSDPSFQ